MLALSEESGKLDESAERIDAEGVGASKGEGASERAHKTDGERGGA